MESISARMSRGLKKYWRRKGYQRLNGSDGRKSEKVKLGGSVARRRRWRMKLAPKIRIPFPTISSPKKVLVWMRDAYVRVMLSLANSRAMSMPTSTTFYGGDPAGVFGRAPPKEYDEKMLVHMYNSLILAQGQLVPRDNAVCIV